MIASRSLSFVVLAALLTSLAPSGFAQRAPFKPIEDQEGLPRVLLIGDSISIGYTLPTRKLLADKANVHRPAANCAATIHGLKSLDAWLGDGDWDVIHFNWGLHDLKYMGPKGENKADPANPKNRQQVPIDEYEKNLDRLVSRLKETGATLIFAATTPIGPTAGGRVVGDSAKYNDAAGRVMKKHGVAINDLYTLVKPNMKQLQTRDGIHFTPAGSQKLAKQVADAIAKALAARASSTSE